MNSDDIEQIEAELECSLHLDYKLLLLHFPDSLAKLLTDDWGNICEIERDASKIIADNKHYRSLAGTENFFQWKNKYFIIGENGCGDAFCMNLNMKESTVYFWDHETDKFSQYAKTITGLIFRLFKEQAEDVVSELRIRGVGR